LAIRTDDLEVAVSFELERKVMTVSELEALAPGRSFPLGTDPLSPVTLTVNGRALASGRLVELGGVLGVQITKLL
jgi:type III secretion protein Q